LIIIFQVILIISLVRGIYDTYKARERITNLEERRDGLLDKKVTLEKKMEEVSSPTYLEKVARDELHMTLPGEKLVILPENALVLGEGQVPEEVVAEKPNWQKWFEVVSGKIQ
jgi:cell division protein FtsB